MSEDRFDTDDDVTEAMINEGVYQAEMEQDELHDPADDLIGDVEEDAFELFSKGPSIEDWPKAGTRCSVCGKPQYRTPGGLCCVNGHGGADPAEDDDD